MARESEVVFAIQVDERDDGVLPPRYIAFYGGYAWNGEFAHSLGEASRWVSRRAAEEIKDQIEQSTRLPLKVVSVPRYRHPECLADSPQGGR